MESRSKMKGCSLMGYQAPLPSKGTRSARGRNSTFKKKNLEGVFMDPFELLATVAENEFHNEKTAAFKNQHSRRWTYSNQIIKTDLKEDENYAAQELENTQVAKSGTHSSSGAKEEEPDDQGSSDENAAVNCALARMLSHDREKKNSDIGILGSKDINEHMIGLKSVGGVDNGDKSSYIDLGLGIGTPGRFGEAESGEGKGENEIDVSSLGRWSKMGRCHQREDDVMMLDAHSPPATSAISEEAPISAAAKAPPPLVSSDSSGGSPICPSSCRHGSMSNFKDEDVNSSECNTAITAAKRSLAISYARKRRDGSGKQRKRMFSDMDSELNSERRSVRPANNGCYELYTYQRSTKRAPSKKRRLDDDVKIPFSLEMQPNTTSATPLGAKLEADEADTCAEKMCTETFVGVSSSPDSTIVDSDEPQKMPNEAHVKVAINSFTVPELTIDIPETASIAKLKRAVMEAAMKLLGGGLRVCMLYQGEKITDENFTLEQVGKPQDGKLESLGFMLEPSTAPTSQTSSEDPLFMLSEAAASEPVAVPRYEMAPCETTKVPAKCRTSKANNVSSEMSAASGEKAQNQVTPWVKSESEAIQAGSNLGALTLHSSVAAANAVPMAMVPVNPKTREMGKRRIRRPFTVTEVEALVHAVEKLGTGRWRDVKLRAFENAKHRTYVDLKDKWKTLVHTAQISPHQRRGEPVPQDLLDRVISAHTFWTEQQARQQAELSM